MAVYNLKEGSLRDREKLLETDKDMEEFAEELDVEMEKFKDTEELRDYLENNFQELEDVNEARKLANMAAMHLKPAVEGTEDRILYPELD